MISSVAGAISVPAGTDTFPEGPSNKDTNQYKFRHTAELKYTATHAVFRIRISTHLQTLAIAEVQVILILNDSINTCRKALFCRASG